MADFGWQDLAALVVVAAAALYLLQSARRSLWPAARASQSGCASGCGSCPSSRASEPQVVPLGLRPRTAQPSNGKPV
jgi:hypothetical protein